MLKKIIKWAAIICVTAAVGIGGYFFIQSLMPSEHVSETKEQAAVLTKNKNEDIKKTVEEYFLALSRSDWNEYAERLKEVTTGLTETELESAQQMAQFVEYQNVQEIYTKPATKENELVAYVITEEKMYDYEVPFPMLELVVLRWDAGGNIKIACGRKSNELDAYIRRSNVSDDVIQVRNEIYREYNETLILNPILKLVIDEAHKGKSIYGWN